MMTEESESGDSARARSELLSGKKGDDTPRAEYNDDETFEEWKVEALRRIPLENVSIIDSSTVAGGMLQKAYVVYTIQVNRPAEYGGTTKVQRRYSEFELLWKSLKRRYGSSGMYIPPLPEKTTISNITTGSNEFVLRRMRLLSLACEGVMNNIYLRNDALWIDFLTTGLTLEDDSNANPSLIRSSGKNVGEHRWEQALAALPAPNVKESGIAERCDKIVAECKQLERSFSGMARSANNLAMAQAAQVNALHQLECSLSEWKVTESTDISVINDVQDWPLSDTLVGPTPPPHHNGALMARLSVPVTQGWRMAASQMQKVSNHLVSEVFEYLAEHTAELRRLVAFVDDKRRASEKATTIFLKVKAKKPTGRADVLSEALENEVNQARANADQARLDWVSAAQVMFKYSLPANLCERTRIMRNGCGAFATSASLLGESIQDNSQAFFQLLSNAGSFDGCQEEPWTYTTSTVLADKALCDLKYANLMKFKPIQNISLDTSRAELSDALDPKHEHTVADADTASGMGTLETNGEGLTQAPSPAMPRTEDDEAAKAAEDDEAAI